MSKSESESTPISLTPLFRHRAAVLPGPVRPLELLGAEASRRRVGPDPVAGALYVVEDLDRRSLVHLERADLAVLAHDARHALLGGPNPGPLCCCAPVIGSSFPEGRMSAGNLGEGGLL